MEFTEREILERMHDRQRLYHEREELRRKRRTVEESVRLADISTALDLIEDLEKVMKEELKQAAREIAKDDPHIFDDYDGFERVMWSDDSHMEQHRLTHDDRGIYEQIVHGVYRELITMTDDEYAKAEKAAERKRDAAEDWE